MSSSTSYPSLLVATLSVCVAAGPAQADSSQGGGGNMPASATPSSTTAHSEAESEPFDQHLPRSGQSAQRSEPNMPAASNANNAPRRASDDLVENSEPPDGAPFDAAVFEQNTILDLDELAPVEVIDLQVGLRAMSLYQGKLDGIAGPRTRRALHQYFVQQAQLALDGKLNAAAISLLAATPQAQQTP